MNELMIIGRSCIVAFPQDKISAVPAKVDTGADTSSVWASDIHVDDNHNLRFVLFDKSAPWYSGKEHSMKEYEAKRIRSSNGQDEIRYRVRLSVTIAGRRIRAAFTLADRSKNAYPILIGLSALHKKFLVDVSQYERGQTTQQRPNRRKKPLTLTEEMKLDPKAFHDKYHGKKS